MRALSGDVTKCTFLRMFLDKATDDSSESGYSSVRILSINKYSHHKIIRLIPL